MEPTIKSTLRELTPPVVWKFLARAKARAKARPQTVEEPGAERQSDYYDAMYSVTERYHCHYADSPYFSLWCVLVDHVKPADARCVLDIGCGPGQLAAFLRDRGLRDYVGIDFSGESIRYARSNCPAFKFVCADVFTSDLFTTVDYDVVISTEFLEHVEKDLEVLDRIRPGTRFFGSVPNFPNPAHVRHFNSAEEVCARYASRFTNFKVDNVLFGSGGMQFFLLEGVRAG